MVRDLRQYFDRVVVVNLDRRPDRWKAFLSRLPSDWPFGPPLRFPAVDGSTAKIPSWWRQSAGAWGCYLSHQRVIRDCLEQSLESVLILEDDARFPASFALEVREFLDELPTDSQLVYFGGQHIELHEGIPTRISNRVFRPFNVNRTHAYAIRGKKMLLRIAEHLDERANWHPDHHIDHHLGELQKKLKAGLYCPDRWLVSQGAGTSDICGKTAGLNRFRSAIEAAEPKITKPMVAVVGPYSGGTSAVAGVLHKLGVPMGANLGGADLTNRKGHFEAVELARFCRKMFEEPWLLTRLDRQKRVQLLRIWAASHCRNFAKQSQVVGGKHPLFCLLGEELLEAWDCPKIVAVDRKLSDVQASLTRRGWGWPVEACLQVSQELIQAREHFLATTTAEVLRLPYEQLVAQPINSVRKLIAFLGIQTNATAFQDAMGFVNSKSQLV